MLTTILTAMTLGSQAEPPVVSLKLSTQNAPAGSLVKGQVTMVFAAGLHGYQNPPTLEYQIPVTISAAEGTSLIHVKYPAGEPATMAGETSPSMTYHGTVTFPVAFRAPRKVGPAGVEVKVRYQQCDDSSCFPPGTLSAKAQFTVDPIPAGLNSVSLRATSLVALARELGQGQR